MIILFLIITVFLWIYLVSFKPKDEIIYDEEKMPVIYLKVLNDRFLRRNKFTIK